MLCFDNGKRLTRAKCKIQKQRRRSNALERNGRAIFILSIIEMKIDFFLYLIRALCDVDINAFGISIATEKIAPIFFSLKKKINMKNMYR